MRVQTSVPAYGRALQDTVPEELLGTIIRIVTEALAQQGRLRDTQEFIVDSRPDLPALLAPQQVANLMGISRNTVDRMAEDGDLPALVLREGNRQRMVRVPKAFVLKLLEDLNNGARIELRDYAATWQAGVVGGAAAAGALSAAEVA